MWRLEHARARWPRDCGKDYCAPPSTHLDADDACATLAGSLPMALLQPIAPYVLEHRSPSEEAPADEPPQEAAAPAEPEDALAAQRAAAQRLRERAEKMREAREARTG